MAPRPIALVTGASSGIGAGFAEALAREGYDLVLVARRRDRLEEIARRAASYGTAASVVELDLERDGAVEELRTRCGTVEVLINNAGFGAHGVFGELPLERQLGEIRLNVETLVALTHAYLPAMAARGAGTVVNVASTAAFQPVPYMAVYGATKAFVLSFSEAIAQEYRGRGVKIVALCPGATQTEFFEHAGDAGVLERRRSVDQVIETALAAMRAGRTVAIDGIENVALANVPRFFPRGVVSRIAAAVMRPKGSTRFSG